MNRALDGIEIGWQGSNEGLTFPRNHFGDIAAMEHHPPNHLNIVMPHLEKAAPTFATGCKSFDQNIVERFAGLQPRAKLRRLFAQLLIAHRHQACFQLIDLSYLGLVPLHLAGIGGAKQSRKAPFDSGEHAIEYVAGAFPKTLEHFHS